MSLRMSLTNVPRKNQVALYEMRLSLNHKNCTSGYLPQMSLANGLLLIKRGPLQNEHIAESGEKRHKKCRSRKNDVALRNEHMTGSEGKDDKNVALECRSIK